MVFHAALVIKKSIAIKICLKYFGNRFSNICLNRGMSSDFMYFLSPLDFVLLGCLQNDRVFLEVKRALMACLRISTRSALSSRRLGPGLGLML